MKLLPPTIPIPCNRCKSITLGTSIGEGALSCAGCGHRLIGPTSLSMNVIQEACAAVSRTVSLGYSSGGPELVPWRADVGSMSAISQLSYLFVWARVTHLDPLRAAYLEHYGLEDLYHSMTRLAEIYAVWQVCSDPQPGDYVSNADFDGVLLEIQGSSAHCLGYDYCSNQITQTIEHVPLFVNRLLVRIPALLGASCGCPDGFFRPKKET